MMATVLARGTVKWFDNEKGRGFILRDNGREIYVDKKNISENALGKFREGIQVSFNVEADGKKPSAKKERVGPDFDAKGMALAMGIPFGAIAAGTAALHGLLGKEEKKQKRVRKGRGATVGMGPSKVTTGGGLGTMTQRDRSKPKMLKDGGAVCRGGRSAQRGTQFRGVRELYVV